MAAAALESLTFVLLVRLSRKCPPWLFALPAAIVRSRFNRQTFPAVAYGSGDAVRFSHCVTVYLMAGAHLSVPHHQRPSRGRQSYQCLRFDGYRREHHFVDWFRPGSVRQVGTTFPQNRPRPGVFKAFRRSGVDA
jgi:hypothetical protein